MKKQNFPSQTTLKSGLKPVLKAGISRFKLNAKYCVISVVFILVFLLGSQSRVCSQTDKKIQEIEKICTSTNNQVAGEELYYNVFTSNKSYMSWPALGNYQENIYWFYEYSGAGKITKKITVKNESAALTSNTEYFFDNEGNLIFYFQSSNYPDLLSKGIICYFDKGKPIGIKVNDTFYENIPSGYSSYIEKVLEKSKKVINLDDENTGFYNSDLIELLPDTRDK